MGAEPPGPTLSPDTVGAPLTTTRSVDALLDTYAEQADLIDCCRAMAVQQLGAHPQCELAAHIAVLLAPEP